MSEDWICPKCKRRGREVIDGEMQWYCGPCNDRDAEQYREHQEWVHYHTAGDD